MEAPRALADASRLGLAILPFQASGYPERLRQLPDPPIVLWIRGCAELLDGPAVAIVGSRTATPTGISVATRLGRELSDAGLVVVSGLARGVDAAAHRGALDGSGRTVAVLGSGADVIYHAAGGSGGGVFEAVKAANKMAIGVDSDQALTADESVRDIIISSMIKKVDVAVFDFIKANVDGNVPSGDQVYDLKKGGVDYATTGGHVDDIKSKIDDYKQQIIDGKITVPTTP